MTNRIDSIWKKIDRRGTDECWPWLGYRNRNRNGSTYGRLDILGREGVYAHRVAYLAANPGSITLDKRDEILVLHHCDNPACCNPKHLFLGTHLDNMRDKVSKGRSPDYRGVRGPRAKLTEDNVREIKRMRADGVRIKNLSELFEVSGSTIKGVLYGRHYTDID